MPFIIAFFDISVNCSFLKSCVSVCVSAAMAELDLSLSDALTDSVPQSGPENLVERDFVAQLESEAFDDQVGETVGKTDYIPLLDNDDPRPGESDTVEPGWEGDGSVDIRRLKVQ